MSQSIFTSEALDWFDIAISYRGMLATVNGVVLDCIVKEADDEDQLGRRLNHDFMIEFRTSELAEAKGKGTLTGTEIVVSNTSGTVSNKYKVQTVVEKGEAITTLLCTLLNARY